MAGDAPLLERLAGVTPVAASEGLQLIERPREPPSDPGIGPLFGVDDEGGAGGDPLVLRLQALSPTLGFAAETGEWAREWLADPFTQDALLVQQCVVRMLLALRTLAETRATELTTNEG